jgi:uncharacterized membrane protein
MTAPYAVLLGLAVVLGVVGAFGRLRRLPHSSWAGIRLPPTVASEGAWRAAHRATGPWLVAAGAVCASAVLGVGRRVRGRHRYRSGR